MTRTEFFHLAAISIACQAFDSYPEYQKENEPYYPLRDEEREQYDPFDETDSPSPSKEMVWVRRVCWAADNLTRFIDRNWQNFEDSNPRSSY